MFPNNITTGMVETLLIDIIPESKKPLLACFDDYCLNIHKINPDIKFSLKSKFFAYLEATEQPLNMEKINFKNEQFWDLNHPAMNNLKSFLFNNITI